MASSKKKKLSPKSAAPKKVTKRPIKAPPAAPPAPSERRQDSPSAEQHEEGPTTTEAWSNDVLWVAGMEKYALKVNDRFDVEHPVGKTAARMHLVCSKGIPAKEANDILDNGRHQYVATVDCDPKQPAVFTNESGQQVVNSYVPPSVQPAAGEWTTIRSLLDVLVQVGVNGQQAMDWMINWFAAKYQEPGTRSFTSVTMIGPQGVGKSAMGELFALLLGRENSASVSGRDFKEGFNSLFATRLFVVVDELVVSSARNQVIETLKTYHSEARIALRTPHAKRVQVNNRMGLWMTSNSEAAVKLEAKGDRRHTVFFIPPAALTSAHKAMVKGMFNPKTKTPTQATMAELAAFAHHLQHYVVDWDRAQTPFGNEAREELARASRTAVEKFLDEVDASEGAVVSELINRYVASLSAAKRGELLPFDFEDGVTLDIVYKAFDYFAHEEGFTERLPHNDVFFVAWKHRFGDRWPRVRRSMSPRVYVLSGLRAMKDEAKGSKSIKPARATENDEAGRTARTDAARTAAT